MKKTMLITGYSGYLGKHFVKQFNKKYDFIGITRKKTNLIKNEIIHNLNSEEKIKISGRIDYVLHFASMTDIESCEENKKTALMANVNGTLKLLEKAKHLHINKFIYISTGSIYGHSNYPHKENETPKNPKDFYSNTKWMAEILCKYYSKYFRITIVRPFFPYGPNTKPRRLIDLLIDRISRKKPIFLNKDSRPRINPIFILDFILGLEKILEKKGSNIAIYNLGGEEIVNIKEISEEIGKILRIKPIFKKTEDYSFDFLGDINKLKSFYEFRYNLTQGLLETIKEKTNNLKNEYTRNIKY